MDVTAIVLKLIEVAPRFVGRPKPPTIDYSQLYEVIPKVEVPQLKIEEPLIEATPTPAPRVEELPEGDTGGEVGTEEAQEPEVATACISCSRSHLSTVSGALGEAIRFAREDGIAHPEVQKRIMMSEDEINILERIDLSPDALLNSPPKDRQLAEDYLPRIRKLRQNIGQIASLEDLEKTAAEANILGQEFRLRALQLRGVDLNPVLQLARQVQSGEKTMEQAKAELKEILPDEE